MAKKGQNVLGAWAFLAGVVLAIIIGLFGVGTPWPLILAIIGIIVGLLNIGGSELKDFMLAGTVLVVVGAFGGQGYLDIIPYVGDILRALVVLFVPATIVVALKTVFALAKK